ncbi:hypothetical protein BKM31_16045 [[Actinomadura] parvosata subsp. kistnae]|uniref:Uncharacterized protein n=1 Tax=[Actinomadura] parvosata subsp. kistnae TaxID=1909395 RepID=A0A1U9ZXS8_9ACTN|nr:hypothetical protein [Nonomuraea sp. ATCC 55076]AQZ62771.1 hypothetical protein BKM31_16045 [Nonomuraea sp. ATCC 55076]
MIGRPVLSGDDGLAAHLEWLGALHDDRPAVRLASWPHPGPVPAVRQAPWEDAAHGGEQGRS